MRANGRRAATFEAWSLGLGFIVQAAAVGGIYLLLLLFSEPTGLADAMAIAAGAVAIAGLMAIALGHGDGLDGAAGLTAGAATLAILAELALVGYLVAASVESVIEIRTLGISPAVAGGWFLCCAVALLLLIGLVRCLLRAAGRLASDDGSTARAQRFSALAGVAVAVVLTAAAIASAGLAATDFSCSQFRFKRDRWSNVRGDDLRSMSEAVDRCDLLIGKTRPEVQSYLGIERTGGPLVIRYGPDGRVDRTTVSSPRVAID